MIGQTISHYKILEKLGEGGMGVVYKAEDSKLRRIVALKFLSSQLLADEQQKKRFLREAQAAAALDHPNITTIHEVHEADDQTFMVMAFIEGEDLSKRIASGPMDIDEALDTAAQVGRGLSKAHSEGIVHRDIKPANVIITPEGQAKVVDFGLAKLARQTKLTKSGVTVGTVAYMSPEQATGGEIDNRTDIWSLGVMLYEMLVGRLPFRGDVEPALVYSILNENPKPVTKTRRDVPVAVEDIIEKALSKDPTKRYATVDALLSDLERERERIALGIKARRFTVLRKLRRRKRVVVAVLATVVAGSAWLAFHQGWLPAIGDEEAAVEHPRPWVLVAEFETPQGYTSLGTAVRHLVIAALDESKIVEAVPPEQLKLALTLAGKPESTRVDGPTARELAYRSGIKTVIEGRIDKFGSGYSIVLRGLDADDGRVIVSVNGTADDENALIPSVGRLVKRLREGLGEQHSSLVQKQLRWVAATPSFAAYRKYAEAFELQQLQGDDRGSLVLLDEALRIDPDFAEAWALKMFGHWHLGEMDSVRVAMDQALRRPQRLTEEGRMFLQGNKDFLDGNLERADATYQELIRRGYQLSSSLGNRGSILAQAGRYEDALDHARRAAHVGPFGPQQWVLMNEISLLLRFGLVEEARLEAPRLKGWYSARYQLAIAVVANDWREADSLAQAFQQDRTYPDDIHRQAAIILACSKAARGSLQDASDLMRQERRKAKADANHGRLNYLAERQFFLALASGNSEIDVPAGDAEDLTTRSLILRGLALAARRDTTDASKLLREIRTRSDDDLGDTGMLPGLLRAMELELQGRWRQATDILAPLSRTRWRPDTDVNPVFVQWITAESFLAQDLADSAAAYLDLTPPAGGIPWQARLDIRMLSSFAHLRLVRLYSQMGRIQKARRHLELLERDVTRPDSEMTQRMVEARAALEEASQFGGRPAQ